jgi:hypothetical protein
MPEIIKGPNGIMPPEEDIAELLFDNYGWDIENARDYAKLFRKAPAMSEALKNIMTVFNHGGTVNEIARIVVEVL